MIIILTTLFLYVMPSNFAFVMVLFLLSKNYKLAIGGLFAMVLYIPLIGGMISDPLIGTWTTLELKHCLKRFQMYSWALFRIGGYYYHLFL